MSSVNLENLIYSVNGKKVLNDTNCLEELINNLPSEAAILFKSQLDLQEKNDFKTKISETIPPEQNNNPVKKEIEEYLNSKKAESLFRSRTDGLQRAMEQAKALEKIKHEPGNMTIYECGVALGIIAGKSSKEEVIRIMKQYSRIVFAINDPNPIHIYSDISVIIFFDNDIVQEMKFGGGYKGATGKGLEIGDSIKKAIEIYAQPRMRSIKGAVWDRFAVFCEQNVIVSIRIQQ